MKLLWVKGDFLHPATKGGQIRTLETLKRLHQWHEVHYVGLHYPPHPESLARAHEYCSKVYPIEFNAPDKRSIGFAIDLAKGLADGWPVSIRRYRSDAMERKVSELMRTERFDAVVCDFLSTSQNMPCPDCYVLFQHNVEAMIWKRHVDTARNPAARIYLSLQAKRMFNYERAVCQGAKGIIAVSESDAQIMRRDYGARRVSAVPTGVDIEYFAPQPAEPAGDLVFVGSMDWMPNIDGMLWFTSTILPLIRKTKPGCSVTIAGRMPPAEIRALADNDPLIKVTGTVPDIRPYIWGSALSIVPLRVGGGTRLKIYESIAAKTPVISTTIGAEGLDVTAGEHLLVADDPAEFARCCLELLADREARSRISTTAWEFVRSRYSWDAVCHEFERLLVQ